MKKALSLVGSLCLCIAAFAQVQTNTYTAPIIGVPKVNKKWPVTTCLSFPYNGEAVFHPSSNPTNRYYSTDTNVLTITFTNANALLQADSTFGQQVCGHSSLTFTDLSYPDPNDKWAFVIFWPTNTVVPTNALMPLTTIGFHTNSL